MPLLYLSLITATELQGINDFHQLKNNLDLPAIGNVHLKSFSMRLYSQVTCFYSKEVISYFVEM